MKHSLILIVFFSVLSCNKDVDGITIEGTIKSANNKEPVKNVNVTVLCWKYGNTPDESYTEDETKTVSTDVNGKYKVTFDKGAFVEMKISLDGYIDTLITKEIYQKENKLDVFLNKE